MGRLPKFHKKVQQKVQQGLAINYSIGFYTPEKGAWFIWWKYRDPKTKKLVRMPNIKAGVNRIKDKKQRLEFFKEYKKGMIETFKEGYSPFEEDLEGEFMSVKNAIDYALEIKKEIVSDRTHSDYTSRAALFIKWLGKKAKHDIKLITRKTVSDYLDYVLKKTSPRTRNNTRADLSALFTVLSDKFLIKTNFIKTDLGKVRITKKTDRRMTKGEVKFIVNQLKKDDPYNLLLYIKIISYNFLRGIEVNRLKVGDINFETREIYFHQKTKKGKTKYIPDIYIEDLRKHVKGASPDHFLFTPSGKPDYWNLKDHHKSQFFGKKLKKIKGQARGGFYGFRHAFIDGYFRFLTNKGKTNDEALKHLQHITGHESVEGLKNYIHRIDLIKPKDYSKELSEFDFLK